MDFRHLYQKNELPLQGDLHDGLSQSFLLPGLVCPPQEGGVVSRVFLDFGLQVEGKLDVPVFRC